jgi:hypothetical protein
MSRRDIIINRLFAAAFLSSVALVAYINLVHIPGGTS